MGDNPCAHHPVMPANQLGAPLRNFTLKQATVCCCCCLCFALLNLQRRFPELYAQLEGDVDKVASRVAWEYLEGMNWVLCYYACGPAALDWGQQQQQEQQQGAVSAGAVGASWSYSYSQHYAPLMQVGPEAGTHLQLAQCSMWLR